jgi:hypothetical protein
MGADKPQQNQENASNLGSANSQFAWQSYRLHLAPPHATASLLHKDGAEKK